MTRYQMQERARKILEILEEAKNYSGGRRNGSWVGTMEFVKKFGISFKVGINKLEHKKKPWLGYGFRIDRAPEDGPTKNWRYRLASYPEKWGVKEDMSLKAQPTLF